MHIKTVNVTNAKNVLVQIPGFVVQKWGLQEGDGVDVCISENEKSIIITPRFETTKIRAGSRPNNEG